LLCPPSSTVGGGGGGGKSYGNESVQFSKTIEIIRGQEDSFNITVYNPYVNSSMKDLSLNITGYLGQYISIFPLKIDEIKSKQTKSFSVKLKIPSYEKSYEEYSLKAVVSGYLIKSGETTKRGYSETQNIQLIVQEVGKEQVNSGLKEAEEAIQEMENKGFNVAGVKKLLKQAREKLENKRNKEAYDLTQQIIKNKETAFEVYDLISITQTALRNPKEINFITGNSAKVNSNSSLTGEIVFGGQYKSIEEILNMAMAAFKRGDYDTAKERINSAQTLLLLEKKNNFKLFLYLYWHLILIGSIFFSFTGIFLYRQYQKLTMTSQIEDINREEEVLEQTIQKTQKDYFSGKLSLQDYNKIIEYNNKKLSRIKGDRINLRNKRIGFLDPFKITQNLDTEKIQISSEIKKLQESYFNDKKVSKKEYDSQFEALNNRLAEIEGERVTLQLNEKKLSGVNLKNKWIKINVKDRAEKNEK
jgi:hypothetical protein